MDNMSFCYLNNYGKDFRGGVFHFKDGEPASIIPQAGDAVIYTADGQNIHSVDEVTAGERLTLTLWFTRDSTHDEDAKLISILYERLLKNQVASPDLCLPFPASDKMYWFTHQQSCFDIRWARLHILGYNLYSSVSADKIHDSSSDTLDDPFEQLIRPLRLGRGEKIYNLEFSNCLHALQVVQFYNWKSSELQLGRGEITVDDRSIVPSLVGRTRGSELVIPCDRQAAEAVFGYISHDDSPLPFHWDDFALAVSIWEDYIQTKHDILMASIAHWQTHQIIFPVSDTEQ
uniref:Prolyl 3-hydroxylase 1 n=1 Tax=Anthurium amnicola TaxID=1678845 RepID=A0A1D1Y3L1_9ARAE